MSAYDPKRTSGHLIANAELFASNKFSKGCVAGAGVTAPVPRPQRYREGGCHRGNIRAAERGPVFRNWTFEHSQRQK